MDLDFRSVLAKCTACIVSVPPIVGAISNFEMGQEMLKEYMKGKEFKGHAKTLPFCRLWCVVEIAAALRFDVALVFKCCTTADGRSKQFVAGRGAVNLLTNATSMVNIEAADAAVAEDKHRDHG